MTELVIDTHESTESSIPVSRQQLGGGVYAPRESPLRVPATVARAKRLKNKVDHQTEPLLESTLNLDERATPVIERFSGSHVESLSTLRMILRPWLPEAGIDLSIVTSVAVGLSALVIPASGFWVVAKELATGLTSSIAGKAAGEAQEAIRAAENGMMMARWFSGLREVGEATYNARSIVRQNYQTALKLQLAVLRPWNDLTEAEAKGDQVGTIDAAARFVAVAPTYIREAARASDASRKLTVSYLITDLFNAPSEELQRKMAVVLPDVMEDLRDRKGVLGMQGADARLSFVESVLAHLFDEVKPDALAERWQTRHSIADVYRRGRSLFKRSGSPARPGPEPTIEYHGTPVGEFAYERTLDKLHDLAEERMRVSLPPLKEAVERRDDWVIEPAVVVSHSRPPSTSDAVAIALAAAARRATSARQHWGRIAGVVPD